MGTRYPRADRRVWRGWKLFTAVKEVAYERLAIIYYELYQLMYIPKLSHTYPASKTLNKAHHNDDDRLCTHTSTATPIQTTPLACPHCTTSRDWPWVVLVCREDERLAEREAAIIYDELYQLMYIPKLSHIIYPASRNRRTSTLDSKGAMLHSEGAGLRGLRDGDGITEGNCMTLLLVVRLTPLPPFLGPVRCNPRLFSDITLAFGGRMDDYFSEDLGTTTG
ncbi:hypothetical protein B0H34DRAFT_735875 [Crassisporium funariophilum]|nr:hypothetical protein B0H34DRAFT_735875 [Crassisporium funariophilum]